MPMSRPRRVLTRPGCGSLTMTIKVRCLTGKRDHFAVRDACIEVFRAGDFKAERLVEPDRVCTWDPRLARATPSPLSSSKAARMMSLPKPQPRLSTRTATRPILPVSPSTRRRAVADGHTVHEGNEMDRAVVTAVSLVRFVNALFLDEDAGADVQHGRHVARFCPANHAKYLSRIRR